MVNMIDTQGSSKGQIELPSAFSEKVRAELIRRAVLAESSYHLQPQGHYLMAGMQTTATYYGAMHSYRSGRHMGDAIRPRQKLGGGAQGDVRKIPSSTKGRRAHPHMIEKKLFENINKREYQNAIRSAIAATISENSSVRTPIIFTNEIESVAKSRDVVSILDRIGLAKMVESSRDSVRVKKGLKRSTKQKIYKRSILFVVSGGKILSSARNLAGVDVCKVEDLTANLLAPGGNPGRATVWSENAVKKLDSAIKELTIR